MMHAIPFDSEVHCIQKATCTFTPAVGRRYCKKCTAYIDRPQDRFDNSEGAY
jgi:hypothetical protein